MLALSMSHAYADNGLNYNYIEAAYLDTEIDDGLDVDGDGPALRGSFALNETFFVEAGYATQDFDFGIDLDRWTVGLGAHTPLTEQVDLIGRVSYVDAEIDTNFGSADDDGFGLGVGLRGRVAEQFELEGGINYVDLDDAGDDTSLALGGRYYLTEQFAVGAGVEFGDDVTSWHLGARLQF